MAEALAALGVFANVVAVADFVFKILEKGHEIKKSGTGALPDNVVLEDISRQLVAKNEALQRSLWESLQLPAGERDEDDVVLSKLAVDCNKEATELINELRRIQVVDPNSKRQSVRGALKAYWDKDKIDGMARRMKSYQDTMNNRLLISINLRQKLIAAQQTDRFEHLLSQGDEMGEALRRLQLNQRQIASTQGGQHQALVNIVTSQHEEVMRAVTSNHAPRPPGDWPMRDHSEVDQSKDRLVELLNHGQTEAVKQLIFQKPALAIQPLDHHEATALHYAASKGNVELVKALLKRGAAIDAQDENNRTPLHDAVMVGAADCVRYLLFQGANKDARDSNMARPIDCVADRDQDDECAWILKYGHEINAKDKVGNTALIWFISKGDDKAVTSLLTQGAPMSYQAVGKGDITPLICAVNKGNEFAMRELIQRRVDVKGKNVYQDCALSTAARNGYLRTVKILVGEGADIDSRNDNNVTPLLEACNNGHDDVGAYLVSNGANVETIMKLPGYEKQLAIHCAAKSGCPKTVGAILARNRLYIDTRNGSDWKPLDEACFHGHEHVVDLLLDHGPDLRWFGNHMGKHALALAACQNYADIVRLLVKKGGADLEAHNADGTTALMNAVDAKHYNAVRELLALGADPNHREQTRGGWLPLSVATNNHNQEMVRLILHEGKADPNRHNNGDACTPLVEAVRRNELKMAEELLDAGADPNLKAADPHLDGGRHYAPISFAAMDARNKGMDMLMLLVEKGKADLSQCNATHLWTPLHEVACHGPLVAVKYLLEHGADPDAVGICDFTGKKVTPLDLAIRESRGQNVAAIKQFIEERSKNEQRPCEHAREDGSWQMLDNTSEQERPAPTPA